MRVVIALVVALTLVTSIPAEAQRPTGENPWDQPPTGSFAPQAEMPPVQTGVMPRISVRYGRVIGVRYVKLAKAAATGAAVGGLAGLLFSTGKSGKKKFRNTLIGTALGAAITGAAKRIHDGVEYELDLGAAGTARVTTERRAFKAGDCVAIENGAHLNIRAADPRMCGPTTPAMAPQHQQHLKAAEACAKAKSQLLSATTEQGVQRAVAKVNALCNE